MYKLQLVVIHMLEKQYGNINQISQICVTYVSGSANTYYPNYTPINVQS